tara:strand:- start:14263 stop:15300 length:1038 start_codon:yes stop_codon:yes gene_type:complete
MMKNNRIKELIERFTIDGNTFGLAKVLLEQTSKTCPCKLGGVDFKNSSEENNYVDAQQQPLKKLMPNENYKWDGTGVEDVDTGCFDEYPWDTLTIYRTSSPDNGKTVKDVVETILTNGNNQTIQDVPNICRIYRLLGIIKSDVDGGKRTCQELYVGDGTKDALLEDWMEKLCELSSNLWYPPDEAELANLKSKEGLVVFQLPSGDLKDVLHRKFEDLVAVELGLDPSNKKTNTYTGCVHYYNVPYSLSDEWFDDGRKKGPVMGNYKAFAVKFKCLPENSKYRNENLQIVNLNHPSITRLYGNNNSSEVETTQTNTDNNKDNNNDNKDNNNDNKGNVGKYDDITWL